MTLIVRTLTWSALHHLEVILILVSHFSMMMLMYELSLEDLELECFTQYGGNKDFCRLLEPTRVIVKPSLEDIELESFAQLGDEQYFDEVVELLTSIFYPMSELQLECEETMELSFPTTYSSAFEPPDFIF
jgi:hypothetical protein